MVDQTYLVVMQSLEDSSEGTTICGSDQELVDFLQNYDKEIYRVVHIEPIPNFMSDCREFFRSEDNLEFGGEPHVD